MKWLCKWFHWYDIETFNYLPQYPRWKQYGYEQQKKISTCVNCGKVQASRINVTGQEFWMDAEIIRPEINYADR